MKDAIRRNFDASVHSYATYEAETGQFETLAARLATVLEAHLERRPERVLDAGAGTGASTHQLTSLAEEVLALDLSREMLAENDALYRLQADFDALPLRDESLEAVVFTASLFLAPDPERAVAEADRVLRPGGVVAAVAPLGWYTDDGRDVFETLSRRSRSPSDVSDVQRALDERFTLETGVWADRISADRLRLFHSIPAVAARLYPRLPPEERVRKAQALLEDVEGPLEARWQWLIGESE